ncbi:hypothetical protein BRC91_00600 [Halobacteriales archaeon QS_4_62_28]|nr:MAG: hypothetical protein BRC91_00600 [Halobacteriales archaeon QS_4_62_28]
MSTGIGRRVVATVVVLGLLVVPVAGAGVDGFTQEQVDADTIVLAVYIQADGDAQWAVSYRTRLDDDNTTDAFESLQADIRTNESTYTSEFGGQMNRTVDTASNATGREMAVENLTVSARTEALPQEYGVVTYRFRWTNFAQIDGEQLRAGDAVAGLFLDSESTLRMHWPEGYERTSVGPTPDRRDTRSVVWDGRLDFGTDEPSLVVTRSSAVSQTGTAAPQEPDGDGNARLLVLATVLAAGGVVAVLWANRRYGFAGGTVPAGSEPGSVESDDGPPPELLSNEERLLAVLDDNNGRMKQQQVADRLDWTAAKTSQVISGLREDDELATFRIGRENVVTLPGVDIADDVGDDEGESAGE